MTFQDGRHYFPHVLVICFVINYY